MRLKYLLYLLLLFNQQAAVALDYTLKFEKINYLEGLSDNNVNCVFQDQTGYIWIGTDNGLNKYDGYNFTLINKDSPNSQSLSYNVISSIQEDHNDLLWIGTRRGLNCLDRSTNRITSFLPDPTASNDLINANVTSLCSDQSGRLWIGTNGGGIQRLKYRDKKKIEETEFESIYWQEDTLSLTKNIRVLKSDRKGILWIGSNKGIFSYNPVTDEFHNDLLKINRLLNKNKVAVSAIHESSDGKIWLGTNGYGILIYDLKTDDFEVLQNSLSNKNSLSSNEVTTIAEDPLGNIWCGTYQDGLNKISNTENGTIVIERFQNDPNVENSLIDDDIRSIAFDKSGVMWVGTYGNGVNKVSFFPKYFDYYLTKGGNPAWRGPHGVSCITEEDDKTVWIGSGTSGTGLFRYDREEHSINYYSDKTKPKSLNYPIVTALFCDDKKNIWIGTQGGGLNRFNSHQEKISYYKYSVQKKNWLSSNYISYIFQDSAGEYWIGTSVNGVFRMRWSGNEDDLPEFTHYKKKGRDQSISGNGVYFIYEDQAGYIWFSISGHGVDRYDKRNNTFTNYRNHPNDPSSISNNFVTSICEDSSGALWFGTKSGLSKFDQETGHFTRITKKEGLPENLIYTVLSDDVGNLWFTNRNLISRLTISTGKIKTFSKNYGLENCKFNFKSGFSCKNGELLFGTENRGVVHFVPSLIRDSIQLPDVVITNFKISNKKVPVGEIEKGRTALPRNISYMNEVDLKYSDNVFSFEFAALNYFRQDEIKYAYKLDKVNKEWQFTDDKNRVISYSNLSPGEYLFQVKAGSGDGKWNEHPTNLLIRISPPWWLSVWAYVLYVTVVIGIVFFSWLYTIRQIKLKDQLRYERLEREKDNELNQMKLRFFTNISHELRTPLTLLVGPLSRLKESDDELSAIERKKKYKLMHRNASRLLKLINQLMDFRKIENGKLDNHVEQGQIIAFIRQLLSSFEELAVQKQINFSFTSSQENILGWYDADKLEKIIYNLLSNAFKYTGKGDSIQVSATSSNGFLEIAVRDTGAGIDPENQKRIFERFYQEASSGPNSPQGTGIGLALTKKLIEQLHGKIEVSSQQGIGSEFKVTLPFEKEAFSDDELIREEEKDKSAGKVPEEYIVLDAEDETSGESKDKKSLSGIKPIVLIVEDNADIKDYIRESLKKSFRIMEASNGIEGLEKCLKSVPDLVISDVMMPEMDGLEFCRKLKTDSRISHIPVILLTAKTSLEQKIEGLDTGADAYITKPFDAEYLAKRAEKLIESRHKLRKVYSEKFTEIATCELSSNKTDEEFLNQVTRIIEDNITNSEFRVEDIYSKIGMSRTHFFNKLKALTNLSGSEFIKLHRLKKAATLLEEGKLTISEVAYAVGFSDPKYFAKVFRKHFGVSPSKFQKS